MKRGSTFAVLVFAALTVGCASHARVVKFNKDDGSGTVAIPNNTDSWPSHNRTAAEEQIAKLVGPSYRIVSEGEFVKGKSKQINLDSNSISYTQQKITEYRISFVRVPVVPEGTGLLQTGGTAQAPPRGTMPSVLPAGAPQPVLTGTGH